ncbi:High-affinity branched-chain amino acid transport system permease protein LivH [subsurface metagenome]
MTAEMWVVVLINGIVSGAMWGIVAVGLSLIFGVMRVINFAHGSLFMVGLYVCYWSYAILGIDPYITVLIVVPVMFGLGYLVQKLFILPLYKRERSFVVAPMNVVLLTAGLWMILDNGALLGFGPHLRTVTTFLSGSSLEIGDVSMSWPRIIVLIVALLVTYGLHLFLQRTNLGRAIEATSQNREGAALSGINIYRTYNITFGIACAVVGIAAVFILPFHHVSPSVGWAFDIRSFIIVILGGMGSLPGALLAGFVLGFVLSFGGLFMSSPIAEMLFFLIFIVVLLFRPQGLLGKMTW